MFNADSDDEYGHVAGESLLLVALPDLDPYITQWQLGSVSDGIDAHVTVLVPFLPAAEIDDAVLAELARIFSTHAPFDLTFAKTARFPEVLYLVPEPDQPFRELTAAVFERWPQCPPYEGHFEDPTPHATVVHAKAESRYEEVRFALEPQLPVRTRAAAVDLLTFDGSRWQLHTRFPLGV